MALLADILGLIGVGCIVAAYFLLTVGKVQAEQPLYSWLNFAGAMLVIVSLLWAWNLSAFILEGIWAALSIYKLAQIYRKRRAERRAQG
jgi:paired small multidrug resistance pump